MLLPESGYAAIVAEAAQAFLALATDATSAQRWPS